MDDEPPKRAAATAGANAAPEARANTLSAVGGHAERSSPTLASPHAPLPQTVPAPPMEEPARAGNILGDRYELLDLLAAGGMGRIFKGRHIELRTPVAIKIMHSHVAENAEHIERFRREARAASRLNHPNVVRVLDFGELGSTFYIVMEYIEGISLASWLDKHTFPPLLDEILPLLLQMLDALAEAHEHEIVHRDLKPDNIILSVDTQGHLRIRVVDFGLAKFQDAAEADMTLTRADAVAGTPGYMSPEQCRSLKVTASTDLYAFGCILTEMLQLAPPFAGDSIMDVISKHMFAPVPPLLRPEGAEPVPPLLEKLRVDLLAKAVSQRPANAGVVRCRLLEAFNPIASEQALPARKGHEPLGSRDERIPLWNRDSITVDGLVVNGAIPVYVLQPVGGNTGLSDDCALGLASQGFQLVPAGELSELPQLLIVDAGAQFSESLELLLRIRGRSPDSKVIFCSSELTPERLNTVIEAGADDAARYPVVADVLGRKLERLARRLKR